MEFYFCEVASGYLSIEAFTC